MTVRWFGPSWHAPVNEPENEMPVPVGEKCIYCHLYIDHGDRGFAIPSTDGRVLYHKGCFLKEVGYDDERDG